MAATRSRRRRTYRHHTGGYPMDSAVTVTVVTMTIASAIVFAVWIAAELGAFPF